MLVDAPAVKEIALPAPLVLLPTDKLIAPPDAPVDDPDAILIEPAELAAAPVEIDKDPELDGTPAEVAAEEPVLISMLPVSLLEASEFAVEIVIAPDV